MLKSSPNKQYCFAFMNLHDDWPKPWGDINWNNQKHYETNSSYAVGPLGSQSKLIRKSMVQKACLLRWLFAPTVKICIGRWLIGLGYQVIIRKPLRGSEQYFRKSWKLNGRCCRHRQKEKLSKIRKSQASLPLRPTSGLQQWSTKALRQKAKLPDQSEIPTKGTRCDRHFTFYSSLYQARKRSQLYVNVNQSNHPGLDLTFTAILWRV